MEHVQVVEAALNLHVVDSFQTLALVEGADLLPVAVHLKTNDRVIYSNIARPCLYLVLSTDDPHTDVEHIVRLVGRGDALLLVAPVPVLERVVDDVAREDALVEAHAQVQRCVGLVAGPFAEVEVDPVRVVRDLAHRVDGVALLEGLGDPGAERKTLESSKLISIHHLIINKGVINKIRLSTPRQGSLT